MSLAIKISMQDWATPRVQALLRRVSDGGERVSLRAKNLAGEAVAQLFRRNFIALNGSRANDMGGKRTNFYARAAKATDFVRTSTGIELIVDLQGVRQRVLGGEIHPVNAKFLAIPARAEAYGRSPREFNNLRFAVLPRGGPVLIEAEASRVKIGKQRKDGSRKVQNKGETGGLVMFWLKRSVTQRPDPTVIPVRSAIYAEVIKALEAIVREK